MRERIRERIAQRQSGSATVQARTDVTTRITNPGDYTFSFNHDDIARTYRIHVPAKYNATNPAPLLVSMHGGGGTMDYQASR